jgi:MoaA/NifB/PqqE/SkfB family radical SAM enzyme/GT2 family glycosyltransferase
MQPIEPGITKSVFYTDNRHFFLGDEAVDTFGPNIGIDGHNLTILFLSLNRASLSIRLLRSILEHLPHFGGEILVADNGSSGVELELLKQYLGHYPLRWRLLEFGSNLGVAGGRNKAVADVRTDWVLSLDNDIVFVANPIPQIQRDLAVLGCHFLSIPLLNPDGATIYAFGGHLQTIVQKGRPRLTICTVLKPATATAAVSEVAPTGEGFLCSFLFGGSSVLNCTTFRRLGGFDSNMFIGFEDIDFSLRLFREGLKVGSSSVLALVHDHLKAENESAVDYERVRYSRNILESSARYLEAKHGFAIWGTEVEEWLIRNEELQTGRESAPTPPVTITEEGRHMRRPRIALITDNDNWAFANISRQLIRYLGDRYEFEIIPLVELEEIEKARWIAAGCQGTFAEGGASAFGQALLLAEDFDIVHVFWREFLTLIDTPLLASYARSLGMTYEAFRERFIEGRVISTSVYDHLFLNEADRVARLPIFTKLVAGYYVSSEKLADIYRSLPSYPPPDAILEDGVDLSLFRPSRLERFEDIGQREVVVGWVGNSKWAATLEDFKGVQSILIPAVEELRQSGLAIRLHLADRQNGHIPHHQMPRYYNEIDVYVCTSKIEGTPNPVLEAMACGVPVISTDVGIVPQAFGPMQRGFILPERSVESLKEALHRLVTTPETFRKLSGENLESIKAWDWQVKAEKFTTFFEQMLQRKALAQGLVRTKICMLPFTTPSMETDGSIRLCSASTIHAYYDDTNMGNCRADGGLLKVWRGEKYRTIRESLFTGQNLKPYCATCEYRFDGPVWLMQLHLALHAYRAGIKTDEIINIINRWKDRYQEYERLATNVRIEVLPLPLDLPGEPQTRVAKPLISPLPGIPEGIVDGVELPLNIDLNSLNRCNVSCVMCPPAIRFDEQGVKGSPYFRLTLDEYKKLTQGIKINSAHFVGAYAEPLMNKEIFSLVRYAHDQGSFTAITSNGTLLSDQFSRRLLDAELDMLSISLHGAKKETAEAVMRRSDFNRVVNNIRNLQRLKQERGLSKPEIYFNYVGMRMNIEDFPDFMDLAADLGVRFVNLIHLLDGDQVVDKSQNLVHYPEILKRCVTEARARSLKNSVYLFVSPAYEEVLSVS